MNVQVHLLSTHNKTAYPTKRLKSRKIEKRVFKSLIPFYQRNTFVIKPQEVISVQQTGQIKFFPV